MVRGLQEKQYQLAAQKRQEANLKHNYYMETVRFFTRESENNKQYNSWCSTEISSCLDKSLKAQQLHQRQSQLKLIFQEEQNQFEKELLELKSQKHQSQDYSIEALKQKLKEKKAEQSLYLPKDCRRFQSHFYKTRDPSCLLFSREKSNFKMTDVNDSRNNDSQKEHVTFERNSSPKSHEEAASSAFNNSADEKNHHTMYHSQLASSGVRQALYEDTKAEPPYKGFTRHHDKSLEETDIRHWDESPTSFGKQKSEFNPSFTRSSHCDTSPHPNQVAVNIDGEMNDSTECIENSQEICNENDSTDTHINDPKSSNDSLKSFCNDRSLPWMREDLQNKKFSTQMLHYLANKDLQKQISNLSNRELQACKKKWWSQALRLREMKNKLELSKEQNMYNTLLSHMDSETREIESHKIAKRSTIISQRDKICTNSSMYDEDAKDLWKKWIQEDELLDKSNSLDQKEILLAKLEQEWKNLDQKDKKQIADLHQNIVFQSGIQNEYNLTEE